MPTETAELIEIRPQPGPQELFLSTSADIAIYGGAAGGGKSFALLMESLRHIENPHFGAVIFRRTSPQIRNEGGLWDESEKLYPLIGAAPREYVLEWKFPSGATVSFDHLDHETDKLNFQGSQIPLIGFDELTDFSESQFFFMLSRSRSTCGVRPYIRATCNPDADSWVADFISWWIDPDTGYPIPERSGAIRWFIRVDNKIQWADQPDDLCDQRPEAIPKSVTFIAANLDDNQILQQADPGYLANLLALPLVERERLLGGNWKIRPVAGFIFREPWLSHLVDAAPAKGRAIRFWDKAGSSTDGDWSSGVLMIEQEGIYYVADVVRGRWSPGERNRVMLATAQIDEMRFGRHGFGLWVEQEPGNGGKESAEISVRELARWNVRIDKPTTAKEARAMPLSAQCEAGNVRLVRATWNKAYIEELCAFPGGSHDDQVDASSGAFNKLQEPRVKLSAPMGFK